MEKDQLNKVLAASLLRHGNQVMWERFRLRNTCILSTAVGLWVLQKLGIEGARELPVEVLAANGAAMSAYERGIEKWSMVPGACAVYIGDDPYAPAPPNVWVGHVVIQVGRTMLDLTADQTSRPEYDLLISPVMMELSDTFFQNGEYQMHQPGGPGTSAIGYRPRLDNSGYRRFSDWSLEEAHSFLGSLIIERVQHDMKRQNIELKMVA